MLWDALGGFQLLTVYRGVFGGATAYKGGLDNFSRLIRGV